MPDSVNKAAAPAADYDSFAAAYSASNENDLFNAYYERPEMIRLAGDVAGLGVLDAGCGSGPLTEAVGDPCSPDVGPRRSQAAPARMMPGPAS